MDVLKIGASIFSIGVFLIGMVALLQLEVNTRKISNRLIPMRLQNTLGLCLLLGVLTFLLGGIVAIFGAFSS